MSDAGAVIAFWVFAAVAVGGGLMVAAVRNLVHAVLFLVLSFLGIAGLYIVLSADFVAAVQILIYAGAISVLMLFAVMLTPRSARDNGESPYYPAAIVLSMLVAATIAFAIFSTDWSTGGAGFAETAQAIGEALLSPFVLAFEIASVLLAAAMIGAIVIVREEPQ